MMIRKIFIIILVCKSFAFCFTLEAEKVNIANKIAGKLINCEFDSAIHTIDSLMKRDQSEPLYPFLYLCALGLRDCDFDRIVDTAGFLNAYQKAVSTISKYEKKHGQTSYSITLSGFVNATHAGFYLLHKQYFHAIGTGLDAMNILEDAKKIDTTNYDVDLFLGFYKYAKGELKKRLWMVLFWYPGSKEQGISTLEACSKKALITSEASKMVLAGIYVNESDYEKSKIILDEMLKKYPKSRFLLWNQARYFEALEKCKEAAGVYCKLAEMYEKERYGDYNALATRYLQIKLLDKSGKKTEASAVAEKIVNKKVCSKNSRNKDVCKKIERYCKE